MITITMDNEQLTMDNYKYMLIGIIQIVLFEIINIMVFKRFHVLRTMEGYATKNFPSSAGHGSVKIITN